MSTLRGALCPSWPGLFFTLSADGSQFKCEVVVGKGQLISREVRDLVAGEML